MKFKINTANMPHIEAQALHAFFGVLAGVYTQASTIHDDNELALDVERFVNSARNEPGVPQPIIGEALVTAKDRNGLPWDERIHASTKAINADGSWKRRKKVDDSVFDAVVAELRGKPIPDGVTIYPSAGNVGAMGTAQNIETDPALLEKLKGAAVANASETAPEPAQDKAPEVVRNEDPKPEDAPAVEPLPTGTNAPATSNAADGNALDAALRPDDMSAELAEFWRHIDGAKSWISFKAALNTFTKTPEFVGWPVLQQQALRAKVWDIAKNDVGIDVDHVSDPTAFVCWMYSQHGAESADIVQANFHVLKKDSATFKGMDAAVQEKVATNVATYVTQLRA